MTKYLRPASVEEAVALLARYDGGARIIAGGTDVMPDLRGGRIAPRCLVDVTAIPELTQIRVTDGAVEVGAAVTFARLATDGFLRHRVHALVDAAKSVGAAAIQNAATWGGNIVQAMPAADGAIIAIALEAEARIVDQEGARWGEVRSLFEGPGRSRVDPTRQLITRVRFPIPESRWGTAWKRLGRRPSLVLPILNCAAALQLDLEGRIARATIAMGPVAPCPFRAFSAEAYLEGRWPGDEVFARAAEMVCMGADPRTSVMRASREYRLAVIPTLVTETLVMATERAQHR